MAGCDGVADTGSPGLAEVAGCHAANIERYEWFTTAVDEFLASLG